MTSTASRTDTIEQLTTIPLLAQRLVYLLLSFTILGKLDRFPLRILRLRVINTRVRCIGS